MHIAVVCGQTGTCIYLLMTAEIYVLLDVSSRIDETPLKLILQLMFTYSVMLFNKGQTT